MDESHQVREGQPTAALVHFHYGQPYWEGVGWPPLSMDRLPCENV